MSIETSNTNVFEDNIPSEGSTEIDVQLAETARSKFLDLKNGRCRYRRFQSSHEGAKTLPSQLIVMVHGIGAYGFIFKPLVKALLASTQHNFEIVVPDLYGRGETDCAYAHTDELFNEYIVEVLYALELLGTSSASEYQHQGQQPADAASPASNPTALGTSGKHKNFILIGHSMGGAVALSFAAAYPHLVSRLCLLAPAGVPWAPETSLAKLLGYVPSASLGAYILSLVFNKDVERKLNAEFFLPNLDRNKAMSDWFMERKGAPVHDDRYFRTYFNTLRHFRSLFDAPVNAVARAFVDKPVLLLVAERDHITPVECVLPTLHNAFTSAGCKYFSLGALRCSRHTFYLERLHTSANILLHWIGAEAKQVTTQATTWLADCVAEEEREIYSMPDDKLKQFLASLPESSQRAKALKKDEKIEETFWAKGAWKKFLI